MPRRLIRRRKTKLGDKRAIVVGGVFGGVTGSEFGPVGTGIGVGVGMKAGSAISKIAIGMKKSKKKRMEKIKIKGFFK